MAHLFRHLQHAFALLVALTGLCVYLILPLLPRLHPFLRIDSYLPWMESSAWERYLEAMDDAVSHSHLAHCPQKTVATSFGPTHVYLCKSENAYHHEQPVLFLPGITLSSVMWGDWMLPAVVESGHDAIAVDLMCDYGKSAPKGGKLENCPSSEHDLADWIFQVVKELQPREPITLLGSSYGALVAYLAALHHPDQVGNLILLAPFGITGEVNPRWILNFLLWRAFPSESTQEWFYTSMLENTTWFKSLNHNRLKQELATRDLQIPGAKVATRVFEERELKQVFDQKPSLIMIGEHDFVHVDPKKAAKNAETTGATKVIMYPNTNHFLSELGKIVEEDVVEFLKKHRSKSFDTDEILKTME